MLSPNADLDVLALVLILFFTAVHLSTNLFPACVTNLKFQDLGYEAHIKGTLRVLYSQP